MTFWNLIKPILQFRIVKYYGGLSLPSFAAAIEKNHVVLYCVECKYVGALLRTSHMGHEKDKEKKIMQNAHVRISSNILARTGAL